MDYSTKQAALAYCIPDACLVSGLKRTQLFELMRKGKIERRKCGRRTLIPADSLRNFLAGLPAAA